MKLRVCLCIPVHDNPLTIEQVVSECLEKTSYSVLVIDDGSHEPVENLLASEHYQSHLASRRLRILRFPINRGKGAAIQRAFADCIGEGFTHALTLDGDGQHKIQDLSRLIEVAEQDCWAIVVGCRRFEGTAAPESSKFGRKFSNFWVKYQTGKTLDDSQSGLRVYPLLPLQEMKFWTRRFDFEIEVLIRLIWRQVPIREVAVDVFYSPKNERISHFHKIWDNFHISCLNTILVVMSLVRSHRSPARISFALGFGVFIGCTPFYGLHTLLAGIAALLFRMNVAALFVGTQISVPPLAPFLVLLSLRVGYGMAGKGLPAFSTLTLETAWQSFPFWLAGSVVVGTVLGLCVSSLCYLMTFRFQIGQVNWTGRTRGGRLGNWLLKEITCRLGIRAGYFCLRFIVPYFYLFAPKARRASLAYWRIINPKAGWWDCRKRVLDHFHAFSLVLLDRMYQSYSDKARFTGKSQGFENIRAPLDSGEGAILLTAHVGAWDLAAAYAHSHGIQDPLHLIQYEDSGATFHKIKANIEPAQNTHHFINEENLPILTIHRLLADGKAVALMGDRPFGKHCEQVRFFGKLAAFDATPFRIAAACSKPVVFTFGFRTGQGQYEFFASPARYYRYPSEEDALYDKSELLQTWVQEFAEVLEGYMRQYPSQWFNFFPFWSSIPTAPISLHATARQVKSHNRSLQFPERIPAV